MQDAVFGAQPTALVFVVFVIIVPQAILAQSEDEETVKKIVEMFLTAMGDGNLDALPDMVVPDANIGTARMRDGSWVSSYEFFEDWFSELKARTSWTRFRELVKKYTVHIEDGRMAFVRADATVIVDDVARSHNIDYFTLVRDEDSWRFLSASYVAKPVGLD